MGEKWNVYRILAGQPEGARPLGTPRRGWKDNIKMDLGEMGLGNIDWIHLAQNRALVNTATNL
jgi:hypothetical protein